MHVIKEGNFTLKDNKGIQVLQGKRNAIDRLWDIELPQKPSTFPTSRIKKEYKPNPYHITNVTMSCLSATIKQFQEQPNIPKTNIPTTHNNQNHKINVIIRKRQLKQDLAKFLCGALFSARPSTIKKASKNIFLTTFPGLTEKLIDKHLPLSIATELGHLRQEKQHLQSTSKLTLPVSNLLQPSTVSSASPASDDDLYPPVEKKTKDLIYAIMQYKEKDLTAADLTGRFPYQSSRGNNYVMVMYHYDCNVIWGEPLKKRTASEIVKCFHLLNKQFSTRGYKPNLFVFDNEFSSDFKAALKNEHIALQLVTPHMHRNNPAERAIQTWKDHFLAGLASIHPDFPMNEWDRLIPQANITLNLLRASRIHPHLSAYASLFGQFDFNRTPLAPPGTKIVIHLKPNQRPSWGFHGQEVWYIGPAMDHYRNITGYFPKEHCEKCTDTVTFVPHDIPIPSFTVEDYLLQAVDDIVSILKTDKDPLPPTFILGNKTKQALLDIATSLKTAVQPVLPPATTVLPTSATQTVSEPRVDKATPPIEPEPRVGFNQTTDPKMVSDTSYEKTIVTSKPPQPSFPSISTSNTKSLFTGKRVPTPGTRFSQRLLAQHMYESSLKSNFHHTRTYLSARW